MSTCDILIVGAGFAGATIARACADAGRQVLVIDRRDHIGGNAWDRTDAHGVLIHPYGPHIFHTNSDEVVAFLSRFTTWRPYEHRVLARHAGQLYPIPINRTTLERFYGITLADEQSAQALFDRVRLPRPHRRTSEDVVLDTVGPDLYAAFFRGYTRKQWGMDPAELDHTVTARIPVRTSRDDRYFSDRFQHMPAHGFGALFARMLDHPGIRVETGTAYHAARHRRLARHLVWTGPVDAYFDHVHGHLPYRSLRFEHSHLPATARHQDAAVINEPGEDVPYTRTTEFRYLTGQDHAGTSLVREFPTAEGDPYYPIPTPAAKDLADRYRALADAAADVTFVGRLAQYRYYNMDQVVAAALLAARRILGSHGQQPDTGR
jgi:UDP-galactopyranose mutase